MEICIPCRMVRLLRWALFMFAMCAANSAKLTESLPPTSFVHEINENEEAAKNPHPHVETQTLSHNETNLPYTPSASFTITYNSSSPLSTPSASTSLPSNSDVTYSPQANSPTNSLTSSSRSATSSHSQSQSRSPTSSPSSEITPSGTYSNTDMQSPTRKHTRRRPTRSHSMSRSETPEIEVISGSGPGPVTTIVITTMVLAFGLACVAWIRKYSGSNFERQRPVRLNFRRQPSTHSRAVYELAPLARDLDHADDQYV
eukprot:TRINITY_DN10806_c0_g2_i1.p1 TRINITY_DN10806_c0_g2~~TRINITY_DN10806_c0_g2_i1.p1  ORF type:complete len:258 (-),score=44.59 TRINITY_DN10806_c0_g2_i1:491-1264(-)